ncbi:TnsA endonuclease N-terminal domain-containing protein [Undibacterium sp. Di27W]|uniref:TnsA endonuclease N-terminal domain-containing protein n=1 Tax=Undibacterium sp. Di27W TaxID=3413036 RepID=UPI003BF1A79E
MITSPVRKIPRRYNGVSGLFPSKKNGGKMVAYESLLERNYMLLLEFDDAVERYVGQPVKMAYQLTNEKGSRKSRYTPDFIVYFRLGVDGAIPRPALVEIKNKTDLKKHKEEYEQKFTAARHHSQEQNWTFSVKTEDDIQGHFFENADFLYTYLNLPAAVEEQEVIDYIDANGGSLTGTQIFQRFAADASRLATFPGIFWAMIANKRLLTDWNQPINLNAPFFTEEFDD